MRVWIDMSNSPHPLLFAPVVRELERAGAEVVITARDNAQTRELTLERWPGAEMIGEESPRRLSRKSAAIGARVAGLVRFARRRRPDIALSHNSYAQIVAARLAGVQAVTAMDFEHQPANHVAFRLASKVLLPEAIPNHAVRKQGAATRKVVRYPGLKEELYLADFEPSPGILAKLGLGGSGRPLVVIRAAPTRAAYHAASNPLQEQVLTRLGRLDVDCVLLTRHPEQLAEARRSAAENVVVPGRAIDARSLMYYADLFIGAGGTMTREAALMGVPTLTMFAGSVPAVDLLLEREGLLGRLRTAKQIDVPQQVADRGTGLARVRRQAPRILRAFTDAVGINHPA